MTNQNITAFLGIYLFAITIGAIYCLVAIWPNSTPSESQVISIVLLTGSLGSQVHAITSFATHTGNNDFDSAWGWWFVFRPILGALLALVFYFSVRGGLLLLMNDDNTNIRVSGVAAISMLVGLFTAQATNKLKDLFDTLFAVNNKPSANTSQPKSQPIVEGITPDSIVKGSNEQTIKLDGRHLTDQLTIKIDNNTYKTYIDSDNHCYVKLPEAIFNEIGEKQLIVLSKQKKELKTLSLKIIEENSAT